MLSLAEQTQFIEHYEYERNMLVSVARALQQLDGASVDIDNRTLTNILIECFCIHLRCLREFLFTSPAATAQLHSAPRKSRHVDDLVADDFVTNWPQRVAPTTIAGLKDRIDGEIAHITKRRKSGFDPQKHWPIKQLLHELKPVLEEFDVQHAATLPAPQVPHAWRTSLDQMMELPFASTTATGPCDTRNVQIIRIRNAPS